MPKFALLVGSDQPAVGSDGQRDVVEDTFQALCALGHSEVDAKRLLDAALETKKRFKDVNALLTAIYEQSHARD